MANRRATPIDRLPYPVSGLDRRELEASGIHDLGDIALLTPSMTVTNLGMGRDKILLRGLSDGPLTGRTQSMVGVYLGDIRLTYNAPDPDLRLVDIDAVEVLRGPQGALYGAGSMGGVVHMAPTPPNLNRLEGSMSAGAGATKGGSGSHSFDGVLNLPLIDGRAALRLDAYQEVQGGYIDDPRQGLSNTNRSERDGGRLTLRLKLSEQWEASAGVVTQTIDARDTHYANAGEPPYTHDNLLLEPHDNDFNAYFVGAHGVLPWGEVRSSLAYISHGLFSRYDASSAPPYTAPPGPVAFDVHDDIDSLVAETTIASRSGAPISWLVGAFFAENRQTSHSALLGQGAIRQITFAESRTDDLDEAALYGEATLPLRAALGLTIGGRIFSTATRTTSLNVAPPAGIAAPFSGRTNQTGFAPKVVLSYQPAPWTLTYLQASEGYRAGGFNTIQPPGQIYQSAPGREPLRRFEPDELWNLEAGEVLNLDGGALRLRFAAFDAIWNHIQSDQLLASGLPFTANIGDGHNTGVEFEGRYRLGGLEVTGEFLFNGPDLNRANPALPLHSDFSLSVVPDASFGAAARYTWALANRVDFTIDGRWTYVGQSRLTLDTAATSKMGDYSVAGLGATLATPRWELMATLDNLANIAGNTFSFGNPFLVRTTPELTPLRPRTLSLTLKYRF